MTPKALEVIDSVRVAARSATDSGELADFLAELERVRVETLLTAATVVRQALPKGKATAQVLSVEEAARRLGRSRWWIYRNKAGLPFITRFPTGGIGISEAGLDRWIRERSES